MRDINISKQQAWQVEEKETQGSFHVDLMLQPSDMGFLSLIGTKCSLIKACVYISDIKAILGSL